jgi:hypothetical protein
MHQHIFISLILVCPCFLMLKVATTIAYSIHFQSLTYVSLDNCEFQRICKLHRVLYKFSLNSPPVQNRWKSHCCWLLHVHWASAIRQAAIHTAEPSVLELTIFQIQMATESLEYFKSWGINQIARKFIEAEESGMRKKMPSRGNSKTLSLFIREINRL